MRESHIIRSKLTALYLIILHGALVSVNVHKWRDSFFGEHDIIKFELRLLYVLFTEPIDTLVVVKMFDGFIYYHGDFEPIQLVCQTNTFGQLLQQQI